MSGTSAKISELLDGSPAQETDLIAVARPGSPSVTRRLPLGAVRARVVEAAVDPTPAANAAAGFRVGSSWLNTITRAVWRYVGENPQGGVWEWSGPALHGGYLPLRNYFAAGLTGLQNTAAPVVNRCYLMPFRTPGGAPVQALGGIVATGGTGSSAKVGIWAGDEATMRPAGLPLAHHNAGFATTTSATLALGGLNQPFRHYAGQLYFAGVVNTGTVPTWLSVLNTSLIASWLLGEVGTATNNNPQTVWVPHTFADDIGALNLTGASFTVETAIRHPNFVLST